MVGKNTTTMKYAILFILLLGIVATACKDEMFTGQTPVDGVAPLQIKNPEVINVEGGALITYDLPDEEDLLYVEAKYKRNSGEVAIAQASVYTDTLKIEGLGDTTRREVQITTVDRSFNRSAAIGVDVTADPTFRVGLCQSGCTADCGRNRYDLE